MVLNNRELAGLILLALVLAGFLVFSGRRPDLRKSLGDILRTLLSPTLLIPLAATLGWIGLELWAGAKLHLWNAGLTSGTAVWVTGTAIVLFFSINKAAEDPEFLSKAAKRTVEVAVFVEFFLNLFVFGLMTELALQVAIGVLVLLSAVGELKPELKRLQRPANSGLAIIGFARRDHGVP